MSSPFLAAINAAFHAKRFGSVRVDELANVLASIAANRSSDAVSPVMSAPYQPSIQALTCVLDVGPVPLTPEQMLGTRDEDPQVGQLEICVELTAVAQEPGGRKLVDAARRGESGRVFGELIGRYQRNAWPTHSIAGALASARGRKKA